MRKNQIVVPACALLLCLAPAAHAQLATVPTNLVPTNVAGIATHIAPPADFDPISAPDALLAEYGLPPRPDAQAEPNAHRSWAKAMRASHERVVPQLQQTNIYHGPKRPGKATGTPGKAMGTPSNWTGTSSNWSGSVDFGGAYTYNHSNSFYFLIADYVVPEARQAYGVCDGGWDYSSSWIGIDGDGSNDVLQAGTESDAFCWGGFTATYYSAWIEWFPFAETRISLPVAPGDDIFIEVWNTTATQGYAYFVNMTTNQAAEYSLTPPAGTRLTGNSAEWVVERPGVGGGLANLTNYVWDFFSACYAYTWNGVGYTPGTASALQLTMTDNSGYPISYPTVLGDTAIWFQDEGSAR
jgi:peptidase A4-like protein